MIAILDSLLEPLGLAEVGAIALIVPSLIDVAPILPPIAAWSLP